MRRAAALLAMGAAAAPASVRVAALRCHHSRCSDGSKMPCTKNNAAPRTAHRLASASWRLGHGGDGQLRHARQAGTRQCSSLRRRTARPWTPSGAARCAARAQLGGVVGAPPPPRAAGRTRWRRWRHATLAVPRRRQDTTPFGANYDNCQRVTMYGTNLPKWGQTTFRCSANGDRASTLAYAHACRAALGIRFGRRAMAARMAQRADATRRPRGRRADVQVPGLRRPGRVRVRLERRRPHRVQNAARHSQILVRLRLRGGGALTAQPACTAFCCLGHAPAFKSGRAPSQVLRGRPLQRACGLGRLLREQ